MYNTPKPKHHCSNSKSGYSKSLFKLQNWLPGNKAVVTMSGVIPAEVQPPLHHIMQSIMLLPPAPPLINLPLFFLTHLN